jgi:hypothetical protein
MEYPRKPIAGHMRVTLCHEYIYHKYVYTFLGHSD